MNPLIRRTVLTEQTNAKWFGRPFRWGTSDCARIAAFHARKFGHKPPKTGGYSTLVGAISRLEELGYATLPDLIDGYGLREIAPAFAMPGDIVSFASDAPIGATGIVVGNGRMLAFHEAAQGAAIISMDVIERAWDIWRHEPEDDT